MQLPLANAKRPSSPGRADALIADLLAEGYLLPIRHRGCLLDRVYCPLCLSSTATREMQTDLEAHLVNNDITKVQYLCC
jgi:hypothetical protein